jgi:hypothetical protein
MAARLECSYLLPLRWAGDEGRAELAAYLAATAARCREVIVVDGSPPAVFGANRDAFPDAVVHRPPDPTRACLNGKVAGVMTAADLASAEALVIADDDVRYDPASLGRTVALLAEHDLVRPQNFFAPLPWHARWDTARTLLNRACGRDYPGTLAIRRSRLLGIGGYDGDVLFENLELIRAVAAAGGAEAAPLDLYVRRLPPSTRHFLGQRVRQAYDDFALPLRMAIWLGIVPVAALLARRPRSLLLALAGVTALAERGRRRAGGRRVFSFSSSLLAPAWVLERGVCAWLAVWARTARGGVRYGGSRIRRAATSWPPPRRSAAVAGDGYSDRRTGNGLPR